MVTQSIRQSQPGRFIAPGYGRGPHVHANGQRVQSKRGQYKSAVYQGNKNTVTLEREIRSNRLKIFDSDAGLEVSRTKAPTASKTKTVEEPDLQKDKTGTSSLQQDKPDKTSLQYDKTGAPKNAASKEGSRVDLWA